MLYRYSHNKKGRPIKTAVIYTEKEHCIKNSMIDPDAIKTIKVLRDYGYEAYIVGGAVRDLLLQHQPKDFDLVTNATPLKIKKIFRNSRIIGRRFRIVHVFYGPTIFEVTTFRSGSDEGSDDVYGTIDEDVKRRDYSINALYYDPIKKQIIDYVNGVKDIQKQQIVPIIPLKTIFTEDPVRMLRAVKYSCSTGFKLTKKLKNKIKKQSKLLQTISASRLTEELLKIIHSGKAECIVKRTMETKLFMYLQPTASTLILENKDFAHGYFKSLAHLDDLSQSKKEVRLGEKLVYLIFDFVKVTVGKNNVEKNLSKEELHELYTRTWKLCRNFVLPMNPQRTELEFAVNESLKRLGYAIKPKKKKQFFKK